MQSVILQSGNIFFLIIFHQTNQLKKQSSQAIYDKNKRDKRFCFKKKINLQEEQFILYLLCTNMYMLSASFKLINASLHSNNGYKNTEMKEKKEEKLLGI